MLKEGLESNSEPRSFWKTSEFKQAQDLHTGSIVTIMLGTNDAKQINLENFKISFKKDYAEMINQFGNATKIFVCIPPPLFGEPFTMSPEIINEVLPKMIKEISLENKVQIIDLHSVFEGK